MFRQPISFLVGARLLPRGKVLAMGLLVAVLLGSAPSATAGLEVRDATPPVVGRTMPPDQSWMKDVPERPRARSRGRVAVFAFQGDDVYEPVRAAVVKALRRKGLNVTASLRPVDSAAQYREMSAALNVAVFIDGEMSGEGGQQSAHIRLRSGVTGQHIASATFSGPTPKIVRAVGRTLWTRVGPAAIRACSSASCPRRRVRQPLRIEAGTAVNDESAAASRGT